MAPQLAQLVAENIFNIDDVKFWMRVATRSDSAASQADKVGEPGGRWVSLVWRASSAAPGGEDPAGPPPLAAVCPRL